MAPSTPTSPEPTLSAALEDAEGIALVAAIHNPNNPRTVSRQCKDIPDLPILQYLAGLGQWGSWNRDWDNAVQNAMPPGTPDKLALAKMRGLMRRGLVDGCSCGCRGDFELTEKGKAVLAGRWVKVGGRGHGKVSAQIDAIAEYWLALARKEREKRDRLWAIIGKPAPRVDAPPVETVRWSCNPPTAPVYAVGSNGWLQTQSEARLIASLAGSNRKLNAQMAAKVSAIHETLGVTPHGTNG